MKIITLSDVECGGKPTAYAAVIESLGAIEIASHVRSALEENWRYGKDVASSIASDPEMINNLRSSGFSWIRERILVEITDVDKFDDENGKKINADMFVIGLKNGTIKIDVGRAPVGMDRKCAEAVIRDALKFYMM